MRASYVEDNRHNRRAATQTFFLRLFAGVVTVIILALCISSFISQNREFSRLQAERRQLERERDELFEQYEELRGLNEIVDSRDYIERIARDYLGMVRPGDIVIQVD
ncbi:MAG TPA: septum formation initiator family protein [Clostridiaceae bacterium]|jgi:cell division protein DivIC|nr:septum formation initiator family protein [Clostridiaceae bacterium]